MSPNAQSPKAVFPKSSSMAPRRPPPPHHVTPIAAPLLCAEHAQRGVRLLKERVSACNRIDDQGACVEALQDTALPMWYAEATSRPSECRSCPFHTVITRFRESDDEHGLFIFVRSFLETQPQTVALNVWTLSTERPQLTRALQQAAGNSEIAGRVTVRDDATRRAASWRHWPRRMRFHQIARN